MEVVDMFQTMFKKWGTIDIFSENTPEFSEIPLRSMTLNDQWNQVLATNLTGQFLCSREALKNSSEKGVVKTVSCAAGKIICMSSGASK